MSHPVRLEDLGARAKQILLYTCCLSVFIIGIDSYAVSVALPDIGDALAASVSQLQWVISAYSLATAGFLMLAGSIADRVGRRKVFQIGLSMFGLGSLLSSFAPNIEILIVARVVQGLGGSMLNPVALSIITNTFTNAKDRPRALGIWSGVIGISMALGPPIGGLLVEIISWRAVFWLNVPVAALAIVLAAKFIPESKAQSSRRFDPPGQLIMIMLLISLNVGMIQAGMRGWNHPIVVSAFAVAAVSILSFIWWENRAKDPLLAPEFFKSRLFSMAVVCAVLAFIATSGLLFVVTLYLQRGRGMDPMHAGLTLLPLALMVAVSSPLSGRLVSKYGPAPSLIIAGSVMAVAGLLLTFLGADTPLWYLCLALGVYGLGFGVVNTPITNASVSGLPRDQAGTAAAVTSTSRQAGNSFGAAIFGSVLAARIIDSGGYGEASTPLWWGIVAIGIVICLAGWMVRGRGISTN